MDLAQAFSWIAAWLFALMLVVIQRREAPPRLAPALVASVVAALAYTIGDALWRGAPFGSAMFWPALLLMWAGVAALPPAWWALSLRFAAHHGELPRWGGVAAVRAPAAIQAFFYGLLLTNPWHGQFLTPAPGRSEFHWLAFTQAAFTYLLLAASVGMYARLALRARRPEVRRQSAQIALSSLIPTLANIVYVFWPQPLPVDPTMVAVALSSLAMVVLITKRQLFSLTSVEFSRVREQDTDAVLLLDPHGRLLDVNAPGVALLGGLLRDPDEALARVAKALASTGSEDPRALAERLARGVPSPGELFELSTNPTRRLRITSIALTDARETPSAVLLRIRDETELALANQRAAEHAAMLEGVFDAAGIGVAVVERGGRIRFLSSRIGELWGQSSLASVGQSLDAAARRLAPALLGNLTGEMERYLERRQREPELRLRTDVTLADGRTLEVASVPLRENGAVTAQLYIQTDVTERRRLERAAQDALRFDVLTDLAGGVAHGFNNLLSAVLGNAELALLQLPSGSPAAPQLEGIRAASERGALLANQLLTYAGRAPLRVASVDLRALLTREVATAASSAPRVAFLRDYAPDLPPALGDAAQLSALIAILLRNAIEAIGDRPGSILIGLSAGPDHRLTLRIADDGCGMSEETLRRAFDPFFSTKPHAKGLGLAAARGIALQHGGAIEAESQLGKGTSLFVRLQSASPISASGNHADLGDWRGSGRLLIVDDDRPTLRVAKLLAESLGFAVDAFDRPLEALEAWSKRPNGYRAALVDATMPELSGPELLREIRARAPGARAVICSGYAREALDLSEFPAAGFLCKPFHRADLAAALRSVLEA